MGQYKYYQFRIRVEQRNEDIINILDNVLDSVKDKVRFYDDEENEIPFERGINVVF